MKKRLKISIPKPCHEDWNKMTQNEKGRFCNSCAKTVVDFTQKSPEEIKSYLLTNQGNRVCGHFYKKQLDSITIEIPEQVLHQRLSFTRVFTLALLIAMGTTLFSCKTDGKTQKIDNIVVVDSINKAEKALDSISIKQDTVKKDTVCPADLNKKMRENSLGVTVGAPVLRVEEDTIVEPPLPTDIEIEGEILVGEPAVLPEKTEEN